jgi:putative transcriptional regulator
MNRLKEVLRSKNIKQVELAETLGVAKSSVSQWCNNTIQPPISRLNEIADAINCDVTELLISKKNIK